MYNDGTACTKSYNVMHCGVSCNEKYALRQKITDFTSPGFPDAYLKIFLPTDTATL